MTRAHVALLLAALVVVFPLAVVALVALLRGYQVDLHLHRRRKTRDDQD